MAVEVRVAARIGLLKEHFDAMLILILSITHWHSRSLAIVLVVVVVEMVAAKWFLRRYDASGFACTITRSNTSLFSV